MSDTIKVNYRIEAYTFADKNATKKSWVKLTKFRRPFRITETLDDSLDSGELTLVGLTEEENGATPFAPFTLVRFNYGSSYMLIESDFVVCKKITAPRLYDHILKLIEPTKLAERVVVDNMTITNNLGHIYKFDGGLVNPIITSEDDIEQNIVIDELIYNPKKVGTDYSITALQDFIHTIPDPGTVEIPQLIEEGAGIKIYRDNALEKSVVGKETGTIINLKKGKYKVVYSGNLQGVLTAPLPFNITYEFESFANIEQYTDWTITAVVDRLLSAGVTNRDAIDSPKFSFNEEQAIKYDEVKAPEFFFTRSTLFDALMTVGNFIHAIPRVKVVEELFTDLIYYEIVFDELGSQEVYSGELPPLQYLDKMLIGDEYCGATDSSVENLLNTTDRIQGSRVEPSSNSFRAVNSEVVRIDTTNLAILTEEPINQIVKVECLKYQEDTAYDITPYVYEEAEYQTLSSYGSTYPYSKSYAITYKQGDNKITGLSFVQNTTSVGTFDANYSIVNILNSLGSNIDNDSWLCELTFRVTYIPMVTARLVQRKIGLDYPLDNTLISNQSSNKVESEYFGTHAKGQLARIGQVTERRTYEFPPKATLPKCGQLIDGMYVAKVEKEYDRLHIKATLTLTPNFNKLAEYIGLNSNYRLYDISEKQSINRQINYGESAIIGNEEITNLTDNFPMITSDGIKQYAKTFETEPLLNDTKITACQFKLYGGRFFSTDTFNIINRGCSSFAYGNSLSFTCNMIDNYGADFQSQSSDQEKVRTSRLVPYGDKLGNVSNAEWKIGQYFEKTGEEAFPYPESQTIEKVYFDTTADHFLNINKDSREALSFTYQLHHQVIDKDIVLGKGLLEKNALINNNKNVSQGGTRNLKVVWCKKLNMLQKEISVVEEVADGNFGVIPHPLTNSMILYINATNTTANTQEAIAIVDTATNELYIGKNITFTPNEFNQVNFGITFMDNYNLKEFALKYENKLKY